MAQFSNPGLILCFAYHSNQIRIFPFSITVFCRITAMNFSMWSLFEWLRSACKLFRLTSWELACSAEVQERAVFTPVLTFSSSLIKVKIFCSTPQRSRHFLRMSWETFFNRFKLTLSCCRFVCLKLTAVMEKTIHVRMRWLIKNEIIQLFFYNYFSSYFFSSSLSIFIYFYFFFLILSSLPENTNLLMRLSFSAVNVVGLEAGVVPVFWSVCFLLQSLRARRASLTWCRNSWVINMYIYSTTSI